MTDKSEGQSPTAQDFRAAMNEVRSNIEVRRLMLVISQVLVPALAMAMTDAMTGLYYTDSIAWLPEHIFAIVGIMSNLLLYLAYLLITALGMGHKTAMSVLYITGVCLTFAFNRNWTFGHDGHVPRAFIAYVSLYALGYVINWVVLYLLVDRMGYDHRVVQGVHGLEHSVAGHGDDRTSVES